MATRGRPRKPGGIDYDAEIAEAQQPAAPVPLGDKPGQRLIPLEGPEIDAMHFGQISSPWMRRRWIRQGKLRCVRIGRHTYLTEACIEEFIAQGGAR
jgi:hypothetical protein